MAVQIPELPNEPVFSVNEAASLLRVTPGRIRQLVVEDRIKPIRLVRDLLIPESQINEYEKTRRPYRKP